jgi:hypothetical protein
MNHLGVRDLLVILGAVAPFSVADAASTACRRYPIEGPDTPGNSATAAVRRHVALDSCCYGPFVAIWSHRYTSRKIGAATTWTTRAALWA